MTDTDAPRWSVEEYDPYVDESPAGDHPEEVEDGDGHCTGEDAGPDEGMEGVSLPADAAGLLRGLPDPRDPETVPADRDDPRMANAEDPTPVDEDGAAHGGDA